MCLTEPAPGSALAAGLVNHKGETTKHCGLPHTNRAMPTPDNDGHPTEGDSMIRCRHGRDVENARHHSETSLPHSPDHEPTAANHDVTMATTTPSR